MSRSEPTTAGPPAGTQTSAPPPPRPQPTPNGRTLADGLWWTFRLLLALYVFMGALQVMKTGAASLDLLESGGVLVKNAASTLGLGWLGALLVLSGSPIAASALTLVAADKLSEIEGFAMLTGSRLGAAFVVLLVAVIYALRGGEGKRVGPVSTAVMALATTALIYIPGALIGLLLLQWGPFNSINLEFGGRFGDLLDVLYGGLLDRIETFPSALLFIGGLGLLLLSFKLIDDVVPELTEDTIEQKRLGWLARKWPMFGLGCLVALIAMSVSVALTVLVPVVAKGYVKREHILPYIMGANITTLGDTLLAAFLLNSGASVRIVLAGVIGTTMVSVALLAVAYPQVRSGVWRFQRQVVKSRPRLAAFTAALFAIPILLITASVVVA